MGFNPAIRAKVRKLALEKKSQLTEKDIFESVEFRKYLDSLATTMGNGAGETKTIIVENTGLEGYSYTNGKQMHINYGSKKIDYFDSLDGKFMGVMGTFFHEKAHDLFLDFNETKRAASYLKDGCFYGQIPQNMNAEQEAAWVDMEDALKAPHTRQILIELYHDLDNIVADRHDEESLIDAYGSFVGESLMLGRQAKLSFEGFFETDLHEVETKAVPELAFMTDKLFQIAYFDVLLARNQSAVEKSKYWESLSKIQSHARVAAATDDVSRKYAELNWIMLYFWPYVQSAAQDQNQNQNQDQKQANNGQQSGDSGSIGNDSGNSQSQGQSGNNQNQQQGGSSQGQQQKTSQLSQEQVQKILNQISQGGRNFDPSKAPEGHHSSDLAIARRANERNGKVPEKNKAAAEAAGKAMEEQGKQALYHVLDSIQNDISQNQAEEELEAEAKGSLVDAVAAVNASESHRGISVNTTRVLNVTSEDIASYNSIMSELKPVSSRLQKQMLETLRDLKDGFVQKHRQFGRIIVASDAYRPDQKYFANKKLPQDLPDMAVSVLVDHSGSMSGSRIESAMKAALLLHDFCTGINIPIAVAGHNAKNGGGGVNFMVYADYEQISCKDKFRASRMAAALTKMKTNYCNRDGLALSIAANLLEKRDEQVKLLMIISDGRPNHDGYGGAEAVRDIQSVLRRAKKNGIEVLACAIGDDKENIAAIYGDSFIDISDLSRLPKTLVSIVKKRIVNSAF